MRFPRHHRRVTDPTGRIAARGWSDASEAEAEANARARLARIEARLAAGDRERLERYGYDADGVITEEVIERFDLDGGGAAVVSRNAYGALVLNNDRVLFIDVDLPAPPAPGLLARLLGRRRAEGDELFAAKGAELARWQAAHPRTSLRAYRTHSGLRLVVLDALFEPADPRGVALLDELGNDPLYKALCRRQRCYRARLSPKPWRVGLRAPRRRGPPETPEERAELERWRSEYERRSAQAAVCRPFATWGDGAAHPVVAQVLAFHDRATGCGSERPLA